MAIYSCLSQLSRLPLNSNNILLTFSLSSLHSFLDLYTTNPFIQQIQRTLLPFNSRKIVLLVLILKVLTVAHSLKNSICHSNVDSNYSGWGEGSNLFTSVEQVCKIHKTLFEETKKKKKKISLQVFLKLYTKFSKSHLILTLFNTEFATPTVYVIFSGMKKTCIVSVKRLLKYFFITPNVAKMSRLLYKLGYAVNSKQHRQISTANKIEKGKETYSYRVGKRRKCHIIRNSILQQDE